MLLYVINTNWYFLITKAPCSHKSYVWISYKGVAEQQMGDASAVGVLTGRGC